MTYGTSHLVKGVFVCVCGGGGGREKILLCKGGHYMKK